MTTNWIESSPPGLALNQTLSRFHPQDRPALTSFAGASKAQADLLQTFPAAAVAMARSDGPARARLEASRRIARGSPLSAVASALSMPAWARKLPPEALHHLFHPALTEESDADFDSTMAKIAPKAFSAGSNWLNAVYTAREAGGLAFAYWIAGKPVLTRHFVSPDAVNAIGAFSWLSLHTPFWCISPRTPMWTSRCAFHTAAAGALAWLNYAAVVCTRLPRDGGSIWMSTRRVSGYDFVPLRNRAEFVEEGEAMHNCIASYWGRVAMGTSYIYSVRKEGERVADMEVTFFGGAPHIEQLKASHNQPVSSTVRSAAQTWMRRSLKHPSPLANGPNLDMESWRKVWSPWATTDARAEFVERLAGRGMEYLVDELSRFTLR